MDTMQRPSKSHRRNDWRRRLKDAPVAFVLLAPALIVIGVFGIAPIAGAVYMSLFDLRRSTNAFIGLANYADAFTRHDFWNSFFVTAYYAVGTIPVTMVLSFLIASALFRIVRARALFRTLYFLPYVTSAVAAAMVWRTIFQPEFGLANAILERIGIPPQTWLLQPVGVFHLLFGEAVPPSFGPSLALCCVILFEIWHSSGFMIVIFLAGLSAVPRQLQEAAHIDGANWFQTTRHVTIPILSPTIFFLAVVSVIKSFQAFNGFYALTGTGRGPLNTTQNLTVYIYTNFYEYGRLGYGAAVAVLLCIAIVSFTILQWRFIGRKVHYE